MNRYQELSKKQTKIAVLGLNSEGLRYAFDFAKRFDTILHDTVVAENTSITDFLISRNLESKKDNFPNLAMAQNASDLRAAGVYYLNGLSGSIMDWDSIKASAALIGKSLNVGDWVIFGPHIDADLAEVVLLELLEKNSGLRLGQGFEIAFHPSVIESHNFDNMGNEMKMSHNLIVNEVERILNLKRKDEFGTNLINYQNMDSELNRIKNKVRELWIPMLNDMSRETFGEFVELSMHKGFLDAYSHLRLSTETHVNWRRFFNLVLRFGVKKELEEVILFQNNLKAV